ncbi:MAG TPA: hypothetical protein VLR47_01520 [Rhodospirillales bacterium]|nr:hypothetical protein [Rhodospirillales bacterium]
MSDAYDRNAFDQNNCCGCGGRLSRVAVRVVHAETGVLLTRLCRRCAGDLVAPPLQRGLVEASEATG